jgi:2-polyprenyl-3-methyl-5-hydroxy-6-metoxy-1,4-benzoquinol methylase
MTVAETTAPAHAKGLEEVCPVCGSTSVSPHLYTPAGEAELPLRRCAACDFIYSTRRCADHERHDTGYHERRRQATHPLIAAANLYSMIEFWSRRLGWQSGARLLDLGCAEGRMVEIARAMGFDARGLDITDFHIPSWRERAIPADVGTVETLVGRGERPFDAIIARQVIEHVADPRSFVRSCASILTPGGDCIIETGNARSLEARLFGRSWRYWVPLEGAGAHVSFLTLRSARTLAHDAGLELVETVPLFRYRTLRAYARQFGEKSPSLKTAFKFVLHRYILAGNVSYRFRRVV